MDTNGDTKIFEANTLWQKLRLMTPLKKAAWACALIVFLIGIMDIAGWLLDISYLKSIVPGWQPMSWITAVCFILLSLQIAFIVFYDKNTAKYPAMKLPAILAGLTGIIMVCVYAVEVNKGSPVHLESAPFLDFLWHLISHVNMYTAILIVIFSSALWLAASGRGMQENISHALSLPAFFAGYFITVSYILGVESIHKFLNVQVAFNTGIACCFLGFAVFSLRPDTGLMAVFSGKNSGSLMARKMLPGLILLPALIGWFRLLGERTGFFSSEVGVVVVVLTYTICFTALVWLNANAVNLTDAKRREAEEAHIKAEYMLNQAQESAHLGSWELELVNNKLMWSDEVYRIFGLKPQEFAATYEAFLERIHPDDRAMVDAAYSGSLRENRDNYEIDHRVIRKDTGEVRVVHEKCDHFRNADGDVTRSTGMVHDITARRQIEDAMQNNMQRFELLSNTASMLLRAVDIPYTVNSICLEVMRHLDCRIFFNYLVDGDSGRLRLSAHAGIPEDEAKKIEFLDFGAAICGCVAAGGKPIIAENIQETADPRTDIVKSYGIKAYACHPILGANGKVAGTLSFGAGSHSVFDKADIVLMKAVTDEVAVAMMRMKNNLELKKSHAALEERVKERTAQLAVERKRLFDVMETLPVYVALLNMDHRLTYANKFFRDRFGEDRTRHCHQAMFGSAEQCEKCTIMDDLNSKKQHNWVWTGPDSRNYDIYDFPFKDADGTDLIMEMGIDVTDSKRAQEALLVAQHQVEQAKRLSDIGTLASTVAHELRNPLATINAAAYNIKRKAKNKDLAKHLSSIEKKVKESNQIINNLLNYSRIRPPVREKTAIYDVLEESAAELRMRHKKGLEIQKKLKPLKGIFIEADPTQLKEVFNNMLNNAVEAVPKGKGRIEIISDPAEEAVKITIRDNGQGIDKAVLEKVFDPFFTTKAKGTGLGLSVCKQIINNHGGSIWLESEAGKGTAAHVLIPKMRETANV